jgi:LAGLIDADG DNA endonuclease family protein
MAYIVGLIATDGCLITGRRAINFKSADEQLVRTYLDLLGRTNRIGIERTRAGRPIYRVQFSDARLYEWLRSVGLSPRKSLSLGAIDVPDEFLADLVRGLLDGDGNTTNHVWKADTSRRSDYYYEWLRTRFVSASRSHLEWLKERLQRRPGLRGWIWFDYSRGQGIGVLSYGKHDSIKLLNWLYADRDAPCLLRKRAIWDDFCTRHATWVQEAPTNIYA